MPDAAAILDQLSELLDDLAIAACGYQAGALTSEDLAAGRDYYSSPELSGSEGQEPPALKPTDFFADRLAESGASRGEQLRMRKLTGGWADSQKVDLAEFIESGGFDELGGTGGVVGFIQKVVVRWLMELSGDPERPLAADFVGSAGAVPTGLDWQEFLTDLESSPDLAISDSEHDTLVPDGLDLKRAGSEAELLGIPRSSVIESPARELDRYLTEVDRIQASPRAAKSLPPVPAESMPELVPLPEPMVSDVEVQSLSLPRTPEEAAGVMSPVPMDSDGNGDSPDGLSDATITESEVDRASVGADDDQEDAGDAQRPGTPGESSGGEPVVLLQSTVAEHDLDLESFLPTDHDKPVPESVKAAMAAMASQADADAEPESEPETVDDRPDHEAPPTDTADADVDDEDIDADDLPEPADEPDDEPTVAAPPVATSAKQVRSATSPRDAIRPVDSTGSGRKEDSDPGASVAEATGRKRRQKVAGSRPQRSATARKPKDDPSRPGAGTPPGKRSAASSKPEVWTSPSKRIESVDWDRAERGDDLTRSTVGRIDQAMLSGTERETFAFLRTIPLFSLLPDHALINYVKNLELRSATIGQTLLQQGDDVDGLYLVYNGAIRLSHQTDEGETVSLGMLGKGEIFGEASIANNLPSPMSARCSQDATVLVLPRATIETDFERNPGFHQFFQEYVQEFYLRQFIRLWTGFGEGLSPKDLVHLVRNSENWKVRAGSVLYKQNAKADCFYIVKKGIVSLLAVDRPRDGQPPKRREVDKIGEGEVFGASELLEAGDDEEPRRPLGARARTDAELLKVPRKLLVELLQKYPELRSQIARRYAQSILTSQTERARFDRTAMDSILMSSPEVEQRMGSVRGSSLDALARARQQYMRRMDEQVAEDQPKRVKAKKLRDRDRRARTGEPEAPREEQADDHKRLPNENIFEDVDHHVGQRGWSGFYRRLKRGTGNVPFIRQHDETDCGAACLAMIARHYGKSLAMARLRDLSKMTLTGSSLANLSDAAETIGFTTKVVRTTVNALSGLPLPAIANVHGNHYVVVWRITRKHVLLGDPAIGTVRVTREEFEQMWMGQLAMLMLPTEELHKQPKTRWTLLTFMPLITPYRGILLEVLVASLILDLFGLASPLFTQTIVDNVIVHQNHGLLNIMAVGMLIILVFQLLVTWLRGYLIAHVSVKVDMRMLTLFFKHLMSLPLSFFKLRKTGDILARFGENTKIRQILTESFISTLLDMMMVVIYIAIMFFYNVKLTLALVGFLPFYIALMVFSRPILRRLSNQMFHASAEQESDLVESVAGVGTIKAMSLENQQRWKWEDHFSRFLQVYFRGMKTQLFLSTTSMAIQSVATLALLYYGAVLVLDGEMSIGQLMAFNALVGMVMAPIGKLVGFWDEYQEAIIAIDRLNDVFHAESEVSEDDRLRNLDHRPPLRGGLELQNVTFAYDENNVALQNVSLKIEPGQMVALVGRSGCGKTTLTNLLMRLYEPKNGKILVDGHDIRSMDIGWLRSQLGIVVQENFLFSGSVMDNVALGDENASQLKTETAARVACAHQFVARLPFGYDTPVGERGLSLSGGERQRLCIARAIYRNPQVLIFDEATSALDYQTEREIMDNIKGVFRDRTLIVIAHRLSTITNADQIIVMDRGMVREHGTHQELVAADGLYAHLLKQQAGKVEGM